MIDAQRGEDVRRGESRAALRTGPGAQVPKSLKLRLFCWPSRPHGQPNWGKTLRQQRHKCIDSLRAKKPVRRSGGGSECMLRHCESAQALMQPLR